MADDEIGPASRFAEAPQEIQRYFRSKEQRATFDWRDLWAEEHAFAFTVAKSAGYDILDDMRQALDEAITKQQSFEEFQRAIIPTLQRKGWWGIAEQVDPLTGEIIEVQLGSPRRLKTIYWANIHTARAAGEWERTQRTKRTLPFLRYGRTSAKEPREEHEAWVGTILPVDHPWWLTHYPPNGWGCQCQVEQITRYRATQLGYDPSKPAPPLNLKPWTNRRTGETVMVPAGIDPGWDTNPGATRDRNLRQHLANKLEGMTPAQRRIAVEDLTGSDAFRWVVERGKKEDGVAIPVAVVPQGALPEGTPGTDKPSTVWFSGDTAAKQRGEAPERSQGHPELKAEDYGVVQSLVEAGTFTIEREFGEGMHVAMTGPDLQGRLWRAIIKLTTAGTEWWLQSLFRTDEAKALKRTKRGPTLRDYRDAQRQDDEDL
jgi:hypothetical protein